MTADDVRGEDYEAAKPVPARTRVTGDPWVRDHLPECPALPPNKYGRACICHRLRACEQRVRKEAEEPPSLCAACWYREDGHSCERPERCMCRDCNYAAGVQAARDAVAGLPWDNSGAIDPVDALAAIDALRADHA